jgi:hypothetical protein
MNREYFLLPLHLIAQLKDLAAERGCAVEQIVLEQFDRLERSPIFKSEIVAIAGAIISAMERRERTDGLWPCQLLDSVCVAIAVAEMLELCAEAVLLTMPEGELGTIDQLSRVTGQDFDQLLVEELLSWPQNQPLPPPD